MEEKFKDIEGYEGLYQVSNKGRVKSLNYKRSGKTKILKPQNHKNGYLFVGLTKNNKRTHYLIHKLVAQSFIPNPNNLPQCNHLDENKHNNCVNNLCWCTAKENMNYGTRNERAAKSNSIKQKNNPKRSTQIKSLDLETNEIIYYPSIREVARQFNVHSSIIWQSIYKLKSPYKNRYIFTEL